MKRLHLGKLLFILSFPYLLWAGSVKAELDRPLIYKGDSAILTIKAEGEDIIFPPLNEISGYKVLGTAKSQSITSINGKTSKTVSQSYTFSPTKSIDIPSFKVKVDGKILSTNPVHLEVSTPKAASKDAPVQLEMRVEKSELYVGEPVRLNLIFKKSPNADYDKIELAEPDLKAFWAKKLPDSAPQSKDGYIIQTYSYLLFPQQAGEFTIPATFAKLGKAQQKRRRSMFNDPFFDDPFFSAFGGRALKWQKLFSNEVNLHVKPLPENLEIYGDFRIKALVDKKEVAANKPLNLTIMIEGEGNIDDIKKFDIDIPDAVIYADEPIIKASTGSGTYQGVFSQKIAIIADRNYTIPSISFRYFDKNSNAVKTVTTEPIDIVVKGGAKVAAIQKVESAPAVLQKDTPKPTITKQTTQTGSKEHKNEKYLYLLLGLVLGAILSYVAFTFGGKKRLKKSTSIIKKIERAKDDKALFELLLPYAHQDSAIKEALNKLEKNLYQQGNEKIDKEEILAYFDALEEAF
jgi:hypothetical protein